MTSLLKLNDNIVVCGTGAFVKGGSCEYYSFPEANIWDWRVVEEFNGSWDGTDSSSPTFNWTACGCGLDGDHESNCCGGTGGCEEFLGVLETVIVFFCEQVLSFKVTGPVEQQNAGYEESYIQIIGSEGESYENVLIESTESLIPCSMTNKNGSASIAIACCARVTISTASNDALHHTPANHSWEFSY